MSNMADDIPKWSPLSSWEETEMWKGIIAITAFALITLIAIAIFYLVKKLRKKRKRSIEVVEDMTRVNSEAEIHSILYDSDGRKRATFVRNVHFFKAMESPSAPPIEKDEGSNKSERPEREMNVPVEYKNPPPYFLPPILK